MKAGIIMTHTPPASQTIPLREKEFTHHTGLTIDSMLRVFKHSGQAMFPTLNDGDLCAIDFTVTWFAGDGLYLIDYQGEPGTAFPPTQMIKRLIRKNPMQGTVKTVSDNRDFDAYIFEPECMSIAGKVIQSLRISDQ